MKIHMMRIPAIFLSVLFFFGCEKNNDDNTPEEPQLTNKEILVKNVWKVDEAIQNVSGSTTHYIRGATNTTGVNYDAIRLKFNANGTGTNTDVSGTTYNMTWEFTSANEQNMKIVINGTVVNTWNMVKIDEAYILETSPFPNNMVSARWVPEL